MQLESSYDTLLLRKLLKELEDAYPQPSLSYSAEAVSKISFCHELEIENFLRKYTGIRTELASFTEGCVEIDVFCMDKQLAHPQEQNQIWRQVELWFSNRFLRHAKEFIAYIYTSKYAGVESVSASSRALSPRPDIGDLRRIDVPDVKVSEWRGRLGDAGKLLDTPGMHRPQGIY
jgi:hypothetical protein